MVGEYLLRERLVSRQGEPARIAAGVRLVQELEVADDVLVVQGFAAKFLE